MLYAMGAAIAFVFIWTLAWAMVDRIIPSPVWFRTTLLLVEATAVGLVLIRPMRRLASHEIPWQEAAAEIEARDGRFDGALQTSVSQLLMPQDQRGSPAMLSEVVTQSSTRAAAVDPSALLPMGPSLGPLLIASASLIIALILMTSAWLDLPRLLRRELVPFLDTAPVTTTKLFVSPGAATVVQGQPLQIRVHALRLGDSQPLLQWHGQDPLFDSTLLLPDGGDYSYTFASVDRPFAYRITGGDATSDLFDVRVIPRPALSELRVAYEYPAWTELPSSAAASFNGDLDAPLGSIAHITLTASQPLSGARAIVGNRDIESTPTVDPVVRSLSIAITGNEHWQLHLAGANGASGEGPSKMSIHATSPMQPQVRLQLRDDERDLRLHPRDLLSVGYAASDQYALAQISETIEVNGQSTQSINIPLGTNHRQQSGEIGLDLARLDVKIGDIVTLTLQATNRAGLAGKSDPCRIVISPRDVDLNAEERLAALRNAEQLAAVLADESNAAAQALEQSPPGDEKQRRIESVARHALAADAVTSDLMQQLLRALACSQRDQFSYAIQWLIDANQRSSVGLESSAKEIAVEMRDPLLERLHRSADLGNEIHQSLQIMARGQAASLMLAEVADAKDAQSRAAALSGSAAERAKRALEDLNTELQAGCADLGIDAHSPDAESRLRALTHDANQVMQRYGPIDYVPGAGEWASKGTNAASLLLGRLTIGSEAEAVRPGADYIWADDLQLAERAARRIDATASLAAARNEYPQALGALQQLNRSRSSATSDAQLIGVLKTADEARKHMQTWAGQEEPASQPDDEKFSADSDRAILQNAAAQSLQRLKEEAALSAPGNSRQNRAQSDSAVDPARSANHNDVPQTASQTSEAADMTNRVARLADEQAELAARAATQPASQLNALAKVQAKLGQEIAGERDKDLHPDQPADAQGAKPTESPEDQNAGDTRLQAMDAIRSAQEKLAEMPSELQRATKAEDRQQQAASAAEAAQQEAQQSDPETAGAAGHLADSMRDAAESARNQAKAAQVTPDEAGNIADSLRQFSPEASPVVDAIDQQLTPALSSLRQAQQAQDHGAYQHSAQQAEAAVQEVQKRLNDGLQNLLRQDAMSSAEFFSQQATNALSSPRPDRSAAMQMQRGAAAALEQAWDDAVHQGTGRRLSELPSLASILRIYPGAGAAASVAVLGAEPAPVAREWGKLRSQQPAELAAGSHDIDPPEYQDALRVYFRALANQDRNSK